MSQYLEIAKGIYSWLEKLQIDPTIVEAGVENGKQKFALNHPVKGEIIATAPSDSAGIFTSGGIAMRVNEQNKPEVYDAGGIYDPMDGRVQGEHYSTTHFALLAATLFQETKEDKYLEKAKLAVDFHLRTSPTEYQPMSEWMYHWDFQNYAFVLTYRFLKDFLSPDERINWERGLKSWRTNHRNKLTNWAAMRAWAYSERNALLPNQLDRLLLNWNLRYVAKARSSDGCFDDNVNLSRPIQYHIFTVAILHRLWLLTGKTNLKEWFENGVDYFLPFIDPEGDFNFIGRGHEQIFGYAAAIYSLEAAYSENRDTKFLQSANKVFEYLLQFKRGDHFPLVLNDQPDEERPGWYDYHHLTVYNAFLGAWLGLTHLLKNPRNEIEPDRPAYTWVSEPTQTAIVSRPKYFAAFFGGLAEYLCEATITPHHLWWQGVGCIFSCPGGPTPDRFGQFTPPNQDKNIFAPIAKGQTEWYLPASKAAGRFQFKDNILKISFEYGPFELLRKILFDGDVIKITDRFKFIRDQTYEEVRFFNMPVLIDKFMVKAVGGSSLELTARNNSVCVGFPEDGLFFEPLEVTTSAKGKVQVFAKRKLNFTARSGETHETAFTIYALTNKTRPLTKTKDAEMTTQLNS